MLMPICAELSVCPVLSTRLLGRIFRVSKLRWSGGNSGADVASATIVVVVAASTVWRMAFGMRGRYAPGDVPMARLSAPGTIVRSITISGK